MLIDLIEDVAARVSRGGAHAAATATGLEVLALVRAVEIIAGGLERSAAAMQDQAAAEEALRASVVELAGRTS
jgi:hypothetical protein